MQTNLPSCIQNMFVDYNEPTPTFHLQRASFCFALTRCKMMQPESGKYRKVGSLDWKTLWDLRLLGSPGSRLLQNHLLSPRDLISTMLDLWLFPNFHILLSGRLHDTTRAVNTAVPATKGFSQKLGGVKVLVSACLHAHSGKSLRS